MDNFIMGVLTGIAIGILVAMGIAKILEIQDGKKIEEDYIEKDEKERRNVQG
jgi:predicted small secreted protein